MGRFLALYLGSASEAEKAAAPVDARTQADGMKAWGAWMGRHAASIVDGGGPLGPTKRVSKAGIADTRNNLTGYVIVEAETLDAAARLFEDHPHFSIFPGEAVEIVECLALPGM
ncbi:hypothetical protein [Xanthomonas sp.]|uniref:hypothetical protein n=1 Tax=Xanthomonas sp. TaxID=29446 RepID=UPI001F13B4EA|nr:hypothetical protein [Xanthomonas sp.]